MTQKSQLEAVISGLIDEVESEENAFYSEAIKLHEDQRLRLIAKRYADYSRLKIYDGKEEYGSSKTLYYNGSGFCVDIPIYCSGYEEGYYKSKYHAFKVEDNKLVAKKKGLLEHFPDMKIENVYSALEQGMRSLEVYKKR